MLKIINLPNNEEIEVENGIVIIGANGSGKTRLGSWINLHSPHKNNSHRITAQKSLNFSSKIHQLIDLESAKKSLLYGGNANIPQKSNGRMSGKPITVLIQDYDKLLTYLFSDHSHSALTYRKESAERNEKISIKPTKIEKVKKIWEEIIQHHILEIGEGEVKTKPKDNEENSYNSSEMSDGERIIFYLIGHCIMKNNT